MTVAAIERTMSVRELIEWRIWFAREPRGQERADWRFGWLALWIVKAAAGKRGNKLTWREFVPFRRDAPEEPMTLAQKARKVLAKMPTASSSRDRRA